MKLPAVTWWVSLWHFCSVTTMRGDIQTQLWNQWKMQGSYQTSWVAELFWLPHSEQNQPEQDWGLASFTVSACSRKAWLHSQDENHWVFHSHLSVCLSSHKLTLNDPPRSWILAVQRWSRIPCWEWCSHGSVGMAVRGGNDDRPLLPLSPAATGILQ